MADPHDHTTSIHPRNEPGNGESSSELSHLLQRAERALAAIGADPSTTPPGLAEYQLEDFAESGDADGTEPAATLELIRDVELDLRIELGRTHMYLEDVLKLRPGAVVPLDRLAGDPVDIVVNGQLVGRGEVLVLNDNFCVRVTELTAGASNGG